MNPDYRSHYHAALIRKVSGRFFDYHQVYGLHQLDEIVAPAGIYILLGGNNAIVHMGKAQRTEGVRARIDEHMKHKVRGPETRQIAVFALDPMIPLDEILGIEGQVSDLLKLRNQMPGKRWPRQKIYR